MDQEPANMRTFHPFTLTLPSGRLEQRRSVVLNGRIGIQYHEQLTSSFSIRPPSYSRRVSLDMLEVAVYTNLSFSSRIFTDIPDILRNDGLQGAFNGAVVLGVKKRGSTDRRREWWEPTSERLAVASGI